MKTGLQKLAEEIRIAEENHRHACYNGSTMQQVGAQARLDCLRQAFALVTETAVDGMHFNDLLRKNQEAP